MLSKIKYTFKNSSKFLLSGDMLIKSNFRKYNKNLININDNNINENENDNDNITRSQSKDY